MALQTGNGVTITFGTSGFTASYTRLGGTEMSRESLETTHIGTTDYKTFTPDDLVDGGEFTVEFLWDPAMTTFPPITGAAETITITYAATETLSGSGFLVSSTGPPVENGELLRGEFTVKWAGQPTYA
jgi:hypothetical protein